MEAAAVLAAGAAVLLGLCALLYYNLALATRCRNAVSLRGKTVLITGGNTGIGKATAVDLARRGARVILACRDKARGESAVCDIRRASIVWIKLKALFFLKSGFNRESNEFSLQEAKAGQVLRWSDESFWCPSILEESGNSEVILMILDLANLNSVQAFAQNFLKSEPRLDILINNAGVFKDGQTADGFDLAFQVNHLAHFLLTHLLLDRLKRCIPSRVVIVSSTAHFSGKIDFRTIHKPVEGMWQALQSYSNSKLANTLHVRELANRLEGTNVTCYAVHPGNVKTEISRFCPRWLFGLGWFVKLFLRNCDSGAQTTIYCATEEGIERLSGQYFVDCQPKVPSRQARDDQLAKKLWEFSERLLGLTS
ncbi:dehydrogenase/reductase SDR family member 13-like isoform 1-T1 [Vipera latastei]